MKINFTAKAIAKLSPKPKRLKIFDEKTPGLAIMIYPTGSQTFIHYKKVNKRVERTTLGDVRAYTVEQARAWASEGARLIGGCCRTTPDDIREVKACT